MIEQRPTRVGYTDLREYLHGLEERGLLRRIVAEVDLDYELGAIAARSLERKGPALLFENVKGYPEMPLVVNIISTNRHLGVAFGTAPEEEIIQREVVRGMTERIASVTVPTGPCKEVVVADDPDVTFVPTPLWHEHDGGRYLGTTSGFVTRDPLTGFLNMGSYRVMITDGRTLSMAGGVRGRSASTGPGGGDHILENEKHGRPTPVAIVMGMDPLLTLASGSPVAPSADGVSGSMEYEVAGGWRGTPTELVKCETSDLLVPAQAEVIVEGEVLPYQRTSEGPHGESTGFYGEDSRAWVIAVKCITHRRAPLTYGLICQRIEDYPRQLLRSGSIQARIVQKTGLTNIKEVYFPEVGRFGMLIVSATIRDTDDPRRIMEGIWKDSGEPWRWIIVVDDDCNVRDWDEVMWRVVSTVEPQQHVTTGKGHDVRKRRTDEVDFTAPSAGLGIDATFRFKDTKFPRLNKVSEAMTGRVAARWDELGLS